MTVLMNFNKVRFDFGAVAALPDELEALGIGRPLFLTDKGVVECGVFQRVREAMPEAADLATLEDIPENPTFEGVARALKAYRGNDCDGIVAVGGGSVIDSAKGLALLAAHPGPLIDYHGHPEKITAAAAPIVAIPTTSGTGSEVTSGAGLHPDATSRSAGVNSPHLVPKTAICDPELTLTMPPALTAGTGIDAVTHCVEGFLATRVNPVVDAIALDGIRRAVAYIERAVTDGGDREARWQMTMAALEGGLAISKGLGPIHAIGNTCGDRGLHHGALVALAMPAVLRFFTEQGVERVAQIAEALGAGPGGDAAQAAAELNRRVGLPPSLGALGYPAGDADEMAEDAANAWFNAASPVHPTAAQYKEIIADAMG